MPGLGGPEILEVLKEPRPETPQVVMLTAHGSLEDAERGKERGAFDYLVKPVQIDNLVRILFTAVGRQQG